MQQNTSEVRLSRTDFLRQLAYWLWLPVGAGLYSVFIERSRLELRFHTILLDRLPMAFDGLQIAQFSDTHLGHFYGPIDLEKAVERIQSLSPHLITFTGDLFDRRLHEADETIEVLSRLSAPLGKYAVLGNHDYRSGAAEVAELLQLAGFHVLNNQHVLMERDGDHLILAGVDDTLHGNPDLKKALGDRTTAACTILLVHEPDFAEVSGAGGVDLQLSGHTHGGQVRLPLIGHLVVPPHGEKYPDGLQQTADWPLQVYTNRGIGTTGLPVRLFCPPEIALLTLRRKGHEVNTG
ncbi:MAG: metallophosphoesterase [Brevibacillus sp.]|nr:metallophosphoesterase [Brevibacillus sp.]